MTVQAKAKMELTMTVSRIHLRLREIEDFVEQRQG